MNKSIAGLVFLLSSLVGFHAYGMQPDESKEPMAGKYTKEIVGTLNPEDDPHLFEKCDNPKRQDYYFHRFMACWTDKLSCPDRFSSNKIEGADNSCYKTCARWMGCDGSMGKSVEMEE